VIAVAFSEITNKRVEKAALAYLERNRPPPHIRDQVDMGFRIENQSLEIFEIRPSYANHKEKFEVAVAKATYVKKTDMLKIYWQRQDLKWHQYDPVPEVKTIDEFISVVEKYEYCCFLG
jgi:hypothetical protein